MEVAWWIWVAVGLLLVASEIFIGAFYVLWFGIGLVAAGVLALVLPGVGFELQLTFGIILGAFLLLVCRKWCVADGNAEVEVIDQFTGGEGRLKLNAGGLLTVHCRGTFWVVSNPDAVPEHLRVDNSRVYVAEIINNRAVMAGVGSSAESESA